MNFDASSDAARPSPIEEDAERILTFEEGCKFLNIRPRKLRLMVKAREVPHFRVGLLIRFRRSSLVEWVAQQEQKAGRS